MTGPTFTVGGVTYTAPAAGTFRFGVFNERDTRLGGEVGSDVNRDGNPAGSSGLFGVLWDGGAQRLGRRRPGPQLRRRAGDDRLQGQPRRRATSAPTTRRRASRSGCRSSSRPMARTSSSTSASSRPSTASHVAGIVAANGMFGGAMCGAAPGAQIVSVRVCLFIAGCTAHALIEGMIYAAKQANVDVINMSIGGLPALNDGNNTRGVAVRPADRAVERADVHLGRQQRPGREHRRRPVGGHQGHERRRLHHRRDVGVELRLDRTRGRDRQPASVQLARPARGWRIQAEHRRPRCGGLDDAAVAAGRTGARHLRAATGLLDGQRDVDGLTAGGRRGRAAGQRGRADGRPAPAGAAAPGAQLVRPVPRPTTGPTSRATG